MIYCYVERNKYKTQSHAFKYLHITITMTEGILIVRKPYVCCVRVFLLNRQSKFDQARHQVAIKGD